VLDRRLRRRDVPALIAQAHRLIAQVRALSR
jgi:hypothetical protein